MWYLILALLFGQGSDSTQRDNQGQDTVQPAGEHGGETSTPRPPRPKKV